MCLEQYCFNGADDPQVVAADLWMRASEPEA
jgi:hypothetical protein